MSLRCDCSLEHKVPVGMHTIFHIFTRHYHYIIMNMSQVRLIAITRHAIHMHLSIEYRPTCICIHGYGGGCWALVTDRDASRPNCIDQGHLLLHGFVRCFCVRCVIFAFFCFWVVILPQIGSCCMGSWASLSSMPTYSCRPKFSVRRFVSCIRIAAGQILQTYVGER